MAPRDDRAIDQARVLAWAGCAALGSEDRARFAMPSALEAEFHDAMLDIYRRAKSEAHYTATRFLGMVVEQGGLRTAHSLIQAPNVSDGYTALWERGKLELTVERLILEPKWRGLFNDAECQIAITRLRDYKFSGSLPDVEDGHEGPMFVTYENRRNPHVTIHHADCTQIAKRGGEHKYSQGGYKTHATLAVADAYAASTGLPVIRCSYCGPSATGG